ncbi:hypothetical protein Tco_1578133 [Tanacetum coccineum]
MADTTVPSQQELDILFGPLYDDIFNDGTSRVNKSSSPTDKSIQKDTLPSTHIQPTSEPTTPTNVHAEENNDNQVEFTNPFYTPVLENAESSSRNIGLQIHQSPRGIFINQAKYTLEILKKHGMEKGQSIGTPMATKPKLDADLSGEPVDQTDYHSKIGSLMYLTSSRPDIVQLNMGLWYPKGSGFELTAFLDADHAGCVDTRKSTSGGIQFLGDKLVSWMSKKQDCTAMSSAEAEYVVLSASCAQVENGIIELYFVRTEYQLADMFTKALSEDRFQYLVRRIEHLSDTYVFTMKMETLLEPASNKLLDSYKDGDGDASFQLESDSLPHAHAQTTKTYYKHQDSRIMKAQELRTKTSAQNLIYKIFLQDIKSIKRDC